MYNLVATGEKAINFRCFVLIIHHNILPHIREHLIERKFRPQGISVKPHMGRDKKRIVSVYDFNNATQHAVHQHFVFPPAVCRFDFRM